MKWICTIGRKLVLLGLAIMLPMLAACGAATPRTTRTPLFFDEKTWDPGIRTIALVEVGYERRYPPPTDFDFERELRIYLGRELERKGYRMVTAGGTMEPFAEKGSPEQLAALAADADAALAVHIDYLFISATFSDRNPPPSVEIAAEARLVTRDPPREVWRDWADATAGGAGGWPFATALYLRQEAFTNLAEMLFDTLPNAGNP